MRLLLFDDVLLDLAAAWLAEKANYQWLDFGGGRQVLGRASLKIMTQRDLHVLRAFTADNDETPIGLVALSDVAHAFHTGTLWYVLGDKRFAGQGFTSRAVSLLLTHAFHTLGLQAVNAWAVEGNVPSIRVLTRNRFRLIGRQRRCHVIDGRPADRLLFDLLASEHRVL
jgi:RimJ/RimL family protein N-acetyltransferase